MENLRSFKKGLSENEVNVLWVCGCLVYIHMVFNSWRQIDVGYKFIYRLLIPVPLCQFGWLLMGQFEEFIHIDDSYCGLNSTSILCGSHNDTQKSLKNSREYCISSESVSTILGIMLSKIRFYYFIFPYNFAVCLTLSFLLIFLSVL